MRYITIWTGLVLFGEALLLRLARLTDYALVVLAHMARVGPESVHSASAIAQATGFPLPTVAKILKMLSRDCLLQSSRGANGGYTFAVPPQDISVSAVIDAMEGAVGLTVCSSLDGPGCPDVAHCLLVDHWVVISRAIQGALRGVSVYDLSQSAGHLPARLRAIGLDPALP